MLEEKVKEIANHFGIRNQAIKTMEECSELIQATAKYIIKGYFEECEYSEDGIDFESVYDLIEELVDARLMIDQMEYLLNCSMSCEEIRKQKIDRTLNRIKKENTIDNK